VAAVAVQHRLALTAVVEVALVRTLVLTRRSLVEQHQVPTRDLQGADLRTTPRMVDGTNQAVEVARAQLVNWLEPMVLPKAAMAVSE